jgi:hypothetical protein
MWLALIEKLDDSDAYRNRENPSATWSPLPKKGEPHALACNSAAAVKALHRRVARWRRAKDP